MAGVVKVSNYTYGHFGLAYWYQLKIIKYFKGTHDHEESYKKSEMYTNYFI